MTHKFRVAPGYPFAQPGDCFFGRGKGGLGPIIRWAERSHGEEETFTNHMGGVTKPGYLVPPPDSRRHALAWVSESQWKVVEREFWAGYRYSPGYQAAVYRPKLVNDKAVELILADWRTRTGNQYAVWRLFSHLGEKLTFGLIPFTKLHRKSFLKVCSHHTASGYVAAASEVVGIGFGQPPDQLDPDEAMDYCNAHPDEWEFVGWTVVPGKE